MSVAMTEAGEDLYYYLSVLTRTGFESRVSSEPGWVWVRDEPLLLDQLGHLARTGTVPETSASPVPESAPFTPELHRGMLQARHASQRVRELFGLPADSPWETLTTDLQDQVFFRLAMPVPTAARYLRQLVDLAYSLQRIYYPARGRGVVCPSCFGEAAEDLTEGHQRRLPTLEFKHVGAFSSFAWCPGCFFHWTDEKEVERLSHLRDRSAARKL